MIKKIYTVNFKLKIAILSLESEQLIDLSNRFGVTISQILEWRKLLDNEFLTNSFINNERHYYSNYNNKDYILINVKGCVEKKKL